MEVEDSNTFPFLGILNTNRGPKFATKMYRKPTHTLHLISLYRQKNFNMEIKNVRQHVMLSSDALETASISEQFSKLNIHFVGY
jgi:hypothetical protein